MEFTNLLRPFLSHTDHALSTEPNGVSLKEGGTTETTQQ
jgi:hypothetical protein